MLFEWDEGNLAKVSKRLPIKIVEGCFFRKVYMWRDLFHSQYEERNILIAFDPEERPVWICFTLRVDKIRVISARYMHKKEWSRYAKGK